MNKKLDKGVARVLDANLNRFREGLRVLEDHFRLSLPNSQIAKRFKALRHDFTNATISLQKQVIFARDIENDMGRQSKGVLEYHREALSDVVHANFKRCEEAARVLEEFSKFVSTTLAREIERIRYVLYELEQVSSLKRGFPSPCLYVLITKSLCNLAPADVVRMVCDGGASVIQLREKDMEDREFLDWIYQVKELLDPYKIPLIVNDRIHLAAIADVEGVHLGQGDLKTNDARKVLGVSKWIGRSTNHIDRAREAEAEGIDYIGVGPLFPTRTKLHRNAVGLEYLNKVKEELSIPYVGIGSVNKDTIHTILEAKPTGLAICTAIISSSNPLKETEYYKSAIEANLE